MGAARPASRVTRAEAPSYLRECKPWIEKGFLVGGSPSQAARETLFSWTNETLNAWTMLPGAIIAIVALLFAMRPGIERLPFIMFSLSALLHAPFAIRLHCTIGVSEAVRDFWRGLDVFFIFTCGVLRGLAMAWYAFATSIGYMLYAAAVAGVYGHCLTGMHARGLPYLTRPPFIRDCCLTVLGFLFPTAILAGKELLHTEGPYQVTKLLAAIIAVDTTAATAYKLRCPERWFPGRFDFVGSGHQIMHVMIAAEYGLQFQILRMLSQRVLIAA